MRRRAHCRRSGPQSALIRLRGSSVRGRGSERQSELLYSGYWTPRFVAEFNEAMRGTSAAREVPDERRLRELPFSALRAGRRSLIMRVHRVRTSLAYMDRRVAQRGRAGYERSHRQMLIRVSSTTRSLRARARGSLLPAVILCRLASSRNAVQAIFDVVQAHCRTSATRCSGGRTVAATSKRVRAGRRESSMTVVARQLFSMRP